MNTFTKIIVCLLTLLSTDTGAHAQQAFTRNLQQGSSGTDVLMLQSFLNRDEDTQVAETGPGSEGNETSYYGQATKNSVIKYQKENGLGKSMGFFTLYSGITDERTRASMNASTTAMHNKNKTKCQKPRESGLQGGAMTNLLSTLSISNTYNEKKTELHKNFMSGDIIAKWVGLNGLSQIDISTKNIQPFIASVDVVKGAESILPTPEEIIQAPMNILQSVTSGKFPTSLIDMPGLGNSMVFEEGDTLIINGCNFTPTVTVNLGMAGTMKESSKEGGTVIEIEIKTELQEMVDKLLIDFTNEEDRSNALEDMQGFMTMPISSGVPGQSSGSQGQGSQGGGLLPQVLGATTDVIRNTPGLSKLPGFSQLLNLIDGKQTQSTLTTPFIGGQEMPGIPVYITVENSGNKGVSNSYQMYYKPH